MIDAGKLRHLITIQQLSGSLGSLGQSSKTWGSISTDPNVYAQIRTLGGSEAILARQVYPRVSHKIMLRYHASLTTEMRIKLGSRIFNIDAIDNLEQRDTVHECMVTEEAST